MPATQAFSLYRWDVKDGSIDIWLDLACADKLATACRDSAEEVGGLLTGSFDGDKTIVSGFDPIECEHRRGEAYTFSPRDETRLRARLEMHRRKRSTVVGYFRSHRRPGLYLDESDSYIVTRYFGAPNQVALLARPAPVGTSDTPVAGFFFWEDGEMNRKQTYHSFPLDSRELANVALGSDAPAQLMSDEVKPELKSSSEFGNAETVETLPSTPRQPAGVDSAGKKPASWILIAAVAGVAAFGGYLVGTSGHKDQFGSRAGDLSFDLSQPPQPAPKPTLAPPPPTPAVSAPPEETTPLSAPVAALPTAKAIINPKKKAGPPVEPEDLKAYTVDRTLPPEPAKVDAAPPAPQPIAPPPPPEPVMAKPAPLPAAASTVSLENVNGGGFKRAVGSIFGRNREANFTPPQAVKSFAPRVPGDLARGLTQAIPVNLRLRVDRSGKVTSVEILSKQAPQDFIRLAGDAAYDWQFEPARMKDKPVPSEVVAHFRFEPGT